MSEQAFAKASNVVAHALSLRKSYDGGRTPVIECATFDVYEGETVALLGPSGSGKSTLLRLISGLETPDVGELSICGLDPRLEGERLGLRREHLGFVFQQHGLIADFTVSQNMNVPAIASGLAGAVTRQRIREIAEDLGLLEKLSERVENLSPSERQLAALGRALINTPQLILADEPTGTLEEATGLSVLDRMLAVLKRRRVAALIATHNEKVASRSDRILRVRAGCVTADNSIS